jgi:hypothetical protein
MVYTGNPVKYSLGYAVSVGGYLPLVKALLHLLAHARHNGVELEGLIFDMKENG